MPNKKQVCGKGGGGEGKGSRRGRKAENVLSAKGGTGNEVRNLGGVDGRKLKAGVRWREGRKKSQKQVWKKKGRQKTSYKLQDQCCKHA